MLGDGVRCVRIVNEIVGDYHDLVSVLRVRLGVAEGSADGLGMLGAGVTAGVSGRVAGGRAQERHVDVQVTFSDGAATSSVAAEHDRLLHQTMGDLFGQLSAKPGGGDLGDHPVLDVVDQRSVNV